MLELKNFQVAVEGKQIVKGIDLAIRPGEVHALMGPNGSGKSTLASALAGHPAYQVQGSRFKVQNGKPTAELDGKDLLAMTPDQRAKAGLFLAFQYPVAIDGVTVQSFLRQAYQELHPDKRLPVFKFRELLEAEARELGIKEELLRRYLNEGFSGGEKKRVEILQLRILQPKYALCDETDSGLDIDALKSVAQGIRKAVDQDKLGCLVITHYQRILRFLHPDKVHIMVQGEIVQSGGKELAKQLEKEGYKKFLISN